MKQFLTILFIFALKISFSQTYVPFISTADSSDQWYDYLGCGVEGGGSCLEYFRKVHSIEGDTVINGENYAKLVVVQEHAEEPGFFSPNPCPYWSSISTFFGGGIRESNKQVFYFDPENNAERLIYDFNLMVGDTVPDPNPISPEPNERIIESIDSVLIGGIYRKRFNFSEFSSPHAIIEGIGSTRGLLPNIGNFLSCEYGLYCYLENSVSLFPDPNEPCSINLGISIVELHTDIFPNPAKDHLMIRSDLGQALEVEIINGFGQTVKSITFSESSNEVDVSDLSTGMYFVKISVDGKVGVQKLMID